MVLRAHQAVRRRVVAPRERTLETGEYIIHLGAPVGELLARRGEDGNHQYNGRYHAHSFHVNISKSSRGKAAQEWM